MCEQPRYDAWHGCMDDLTTELSFDVQATWVNDVLDIIFDMADVRSTGAGIKLWYCTYIPTYMHTYKHIYINTYVNYISLV